jgi:hypothetical protein
VTDNIESDNFTSGSSGWRIERDTGDAEFNDVTVRGDIRVDNPNSYIDTRGGSINGALIGGSGAYNNIAYFSHDSVNDTARIINSGTGAGLRVYVNNGNLGSGAGDGVEIVNEGGSGSTCIDAKTLNGGHAQVALSSANGGYAFVAKSNAGAGLCLYDETGGGIDPFTGAHIGMMMKTVEAEPGDILIDIDVVSRTISDSFTEVSPSSVPNQKAAIGVLQRVRDQWIITPSFIDREATYAAQAAAPPGEYVDNIYLSDPIATYGETHDCVSINSVGEGAINVIGEGGNLEAGDLIVTSSTPGKGMKQSDDIVRSYTVAKAREDVTFSSSTEVKMVACIYLCG